MNQYDIMFGGQDTSDKNLADAMARAKVFDVDLRKQSRNPLPESMTPISLLPIKDRVCHQCDQGNQERTNATNHQIIKYIRYL